MGKFGEKWGKIGNSATWIKLLFKIYTLSVLELDGNGEKWGRMGTNGEKWGENWEEWRKMGKNGEGWSGEW